MLRLAGSRLFPPAATPRALRRGLSRDGDGGRRGQRLRGRAGVTVGTADTPGRRRKASVDQRGRGRGKGKGRGRRAAGGGGAAGAADDAAQGLSASAGRPRFCCARCRPERGGPPGDKGRSEPGPEPGSGSGPGRAPAPAAAAHTEHLPQPCPPTTSGASRRDV